MIRTILRFALFAAAVWVLLQVAFGILGTLIGLAIAVFWLAAIGYVCYLVLRFVSPGTAAKVRAAIRGRPANAA